MINSLLLYPDPGSNRDGLPHWCLRPARLPIPPSGLKCDCKGNESFFYEQKNELFFVFSHKKAPFLREKELKIEKMWG